MKKILVTGAAGFIGYHTIKRLLEEADMQVMGIDNINSYYDPALKLGRLADSGINTAQIQYNKLQQSATDPLYHFAKLNLEDKENLIRIFEEQRFDYVIALAAQAGVRYSLEAPDAFVQSNIVGFMNILECCRQFPVKHLIYASTSSVYGLNATMPFKPSHPANHPISLYAATKKANEMMAHSYSHLFGIPSTGLRFFTVYGPWGRPDMALFKFANAIMAGKAIDVYNNGNMVRDFTYVADIVENVVRLIEFPPQATSNWHAQNPDPATSSAPYRILNIGNNNPVALLEYIETLERALGMKAERNLMPMQPGDVQSTFADVADLEVITNYSPQTTVEHGIQRFAEWYKTFYGY